MFQDFNDFRDKPSIEVSSQLINSGSEIQLNLNPSITYTSQDAIDTLTPEQRDCYNDGEVHLTTFPWKDGYQYSMNNCLIDQVTIDIMFNCRCYPKFFTPCYNCDFHVEYFLPRCSGESLLCEQTRFNNLGTYAYYTVNRVTS